MADLVFEALTICIDIALEEISGSSLEETMFDIYTAVDDVDVDALPTSNGIVVLDLSCGSRVPDVIQFLARGQGL